MFEIMPESSGNVVGVKATGKLIDAGYKKIEPEIDKIIEETGSINFLLDFTEMEGFSVKAIIDDTDYCMKYDKKMNKIATVGHRKWEKDMNTICKPFMHGEVKYFDESQLQEAWDWLRE